MHLPLHLALFWQAVALVLGPDIPPLHVVKIFSSIFPLESTINCGLHQVLSWFIIGQSPIIPRHFKNQALILRPNLTTLIKIPTILR